MHFPNLRKPTHLLATWFGIGLLRPAPGTWGSLVGALLWFFLPNAHTWIWLILPLFILLSWYVCAEANKDSDSDDHSSIVIDEEDGLVYQLGNVEDFATKMTLLLENKDLRMKFGREARLKVEESYSLQIGLEKIERFYQSL